MFENEKPVFEVRSPDGRVLAIYASGRIEGFPEDCTIIINRIPARDAQLRLHYGTKERV